jgi:ubiquinone/menaquinone biosynthesis C-methylase UbiE
MNRTGPENQSKGGGIFTDVGGHILAAEIIRKYSKNREDIRSLAFKGLSFERCRNILDLGCGFGFFTEALMGKVSRDAAVIGIDLNEGYRDFFLKAGRNAGVQGEFLSSGASTLKSFGNEKFDLVLCSYALYFFPEMIPEISRVLKRDGKFVAITHRKKNMGELIEAIKGIIAQDETGRGKRLPIEEVIERFSGENGLYSLQPWFAQVQAVDYRNSLIFGREDIFDLVAYFKYKGPFFLSGLDLELETVGNLLATHLKESLSPDDSFVMSKDDTIFICSDPADDRRRKDEKEDP